MSGSGNVGTGSAIRAALEQAFDEAEGTETPAAEVEAAPEVETPAVETEPTTPAKEAAPAEGEKTAADRARDEQGRFAKGDRQKAAKPAPPVRPSAKTPAAAAPAVATPPPPPSVGGEQPATPAAAGAAAKAPQSWKPAAREAFAKAPPEVQQEVLRVDAEVRRVMQESSESRKFVQRFGQALQPYMPMVQAAGGDPVEYTRSLFQTVAALQHGAPAAKAQMVAKLVQTFGVDINALDAALAGQPVPQQQAAPQHIDPTQLVSQVKQQLMGELTKQRQQAMQQKLAQELEAAAPKMEFLDDVKETMADLLEVAGKRGLHLSLEDAYNRAVQLHPDVAGVLKQREEAARAANAKASTQRARAASSSVKTQPTGTPPAPKASGIAATLSDVWDSLSE